MGANFFVNLPEEDFDAEVRGREVLTTGQVARLCGGTAPRTVSKWFDRGLLKGYRLPGEGKDRRVPKAELVRFMRDNGLPIPRCLQTVVTVLIATDDRVLFDLLRMGLPAGWNVSRKFDILDAALSAARDSPDAVVLDLSLGRNNCLRAAMELSKPPSQVKFFALCPEGDPGAPTECFSRSWTAPYEHEEVASKIAELLR